MHDVLRQRILRKLEAIPDEKVYQVLDYIEFLESEYAEEPSARPSGIRRFAERFEDRMRGNAVRPGAIRGAVSLLSTADRFLSGVTRRGRRIVDDLTSADRRETRREGSPTSPGEEAGSG